MTSGRWREVKEILQPALALAPEDRPRYLEQACAGDESLRSEIEAFLKYEEEARSALHVTGWQDQGEAPPADPERAGPYRIRHRIGEGGMGVVYLAERDDGEYRHEVAVKVMKAGASADRMVRRFRNERQILAELDHPNIARLIDSGTTAAARLYYVMDYVDGVPVTAFCDGRQLAVRQRIRLFLEICSAVAYAHRKLIVHGDLKPGNILVGADGRLKLVDFGLARVFREAAPSEDTSSVRMMTPAYASPEQVQGKRLGTASDVYSLGVLLYELLAGCSPYARSGDSPLEICRAICEEDSTPPSAAVRGRVKSPVTSLDLKGDLDSIVAMAMRKEPERRYGSVRELADDLERYLRGFPVTASRGTALYRFGKYARRHAWGMAASGLGAVAAIAAAGVIWWQGRQAELRFEEVRSLAHSVIFELHDSIQDLPGSTAARKLLIERALEYLHRLDASGGKKPGMDLELAAAYQKIGEIQSSDYRGSVSDTAGAVESFGNARRLLGAAMRSDPRNTALWQLLSDLDQKLAAVYEQRGDEPARAAAAGEAEALRWKLVRLSPGNRGLEGSALRFTAVNLSSLGKWSEALPAWEKAAAVYEAARREAPADAEIMGLLASAYDGWASACKELYDWPCAIEQYRQAVRLESARLARSPIDTRVAMLLSFHLIDLAWVEHRAGKQAQAVAHQQRALALQQQIADADPQNFMARLETGKTLVTTGLIHKGAGELTKAIESLGQAAGIFQAMLDRDPGNQSTLLHLAWSCSELGDVYMSRALDRRNRDDWQQAAVWLVRSSGVLEKVNLSGKILGLLDDKRLRASVPVRLAECRRRLSGRP